MKKLLVTSLTFFILLAIHSCSTEESPGKTDYVKLLGNQDYVVHDSRLIVKNVAVFESLYKKLAGMDERSLQEWETGIGFKSLRSHYNEMIDDENELLNKLLEKYNPDQRLTRAEIGYAESTKQLLDKGSVIADNDGVFQMNVTSPVYASLVNDEGIVQVGEKIINYGRDSINVIVNGDASKIKLLAGDVKNDKNIQTYPVRRNVFIKDYSSRTKALTSCSDTEDKYRLIGYEELVSYGEDGSPCSLFLTDYYLELRMLHRSLGQWWNTKTSDMSAYVSYNANHFDCDGTLNRHVSTATGSNYSCSFSHTCDIYLIERYNTGECTNNSPSCIGQPGFVGFSSRYHVINGKNGTTCNLGY